MQPTHSLRCTNPELGELRAAYEVDALRGEPLERFELHLLGCDACQESLDDLAPVVAELAAQAPRIDPPAPLAQKMGEAAAEVVRAAREVFDQLLPGPDLTLGLAAARGTGAATLDPDVAERMEAGDFGGAADALRHSLGTESPTPEDCWLAAMLDDRAGRTHSALTAFESAVTADPHHPLYRWSAATLALEAGRLRTALAHLHQVEAAQGLLAREAGALSARVAALVEAEG